MSTPSVSTAPRTRAEKRAYWQRLLAEWQRSAMPIVSFCTQRGLEPSVFYRWRRQLALCAKRTESPPKPMSRRGSAFQPIALAPTTEVEVLLAHGARVRLSGRSAERLLDQLLGALAC